MMKNNTEEKIVSLINEAECAKLKERDNNSLRELACKLLMALPDEKRRTIIGELQ